MDKRGRKLTDYDAHRHNLQTLQSNPKKRDEVKIARAKEHLEEARRTYEMLNIDLHDELPALHDSRIPFFVSNLQTVCSAEVLFHAETSKVWGLAQIHQVFVEEVLFEKTYIILEFIIFLKIY